jgi:hypothetical protein
MPWVEEVAVAAKEVSDFLAAAREALKRAQ